MTNRFVDENTLGEVFLYQIIIIPRADEVMD